MLAVLERVRAEIALDLLVVGSREHRDVFRAMTDAGRPIDQVFLWYNLLSDIDGMEDTDLVVDWRGERSQGWGGWAEKGSEVSETFRFCLPEQSGGSSEDARARCPSFLSRYPFTGVFLDKLRFPSPANGLDEVLTCFCDHCRDAASAIDLDLDAVGAAVCRSRHPRRASPAGGGRAGASWLHALAAANPLLPGFSVSGWTASPGWSPRPGPKLHASAGAVALDLFSPGLAPLVGQDYRALSRLCVWAKPMTYRVALGSGWASPRNSCPGRRHRADVRRRRGTRLGLGRAPRCGLRRRHVRRDP